MAMDLTKNFDLKTEEKFREIWEYKIKFFYFLYVSGHFDCFVEYFSSF